MERQAQVDYENQMLLHKMTNIMKNRGSLDNWNDYETKRSVFVYFCISFTLLNDNPIIINDSNENE